MQYITFRAEIIPNQPFLPAEELEKKERKKERKERKEVEVKLLERPNAIIPKDLQEAMIGRHRRWQFPQVATTVDDHFVDIEETQPPEVQDVETQVLKSEVVGLYIKKKERDWANRRLAKRTRRSSLETARDREILQKLRIYSPSLTGKMMCIMIMMILLCMTI